MLDENGVSKGTGFVAFSSPDDAARAVIFHSFVIHLWVLFSEYEWKLELIFMSLLMCFLDK